MIGNDPPNPVFGVKDFPVTAADVLSCLVVCDCVVLSVCVGVHVAM